MKKRILALLLAGILATSLISCVGDGEKNPDGTDGSGTSTESATDSGSRLPEDEPEEDDFWVEETGTI